jgi:omega-6 fatty acid desaturase (delta-12 desaturase)
LAAEIPSIFGLFGLVSSSYGMWTGLCAVVVPAFVSRGMLAYLFFAQHNYPDAKFQSGSDWNYTFAALHNSSMFEMSPLMHWFTGNEGYHHVHHINHNIPFYRLPEAMKGIPQLQKPGRTSWRLRDIAACFAVSVWSPERNKMLK